jgi:DsbC/DsbD-like thiol-disulfide interchange protein
MIFCHKSFRHVPLSIAGVALVLCGIALSPAVAADASAWSQDSKSAMRLIAGANKADDAALRAGIEMKLEQGWHTYWRYPGDSGLPPRFDFSGSENLKTANVRYPAPRLFSDGSGEAIGYSDSVILPIQIVPRQPGKPVILRLKLDYAVCEKLCMPVEARAELPIAAGVSANEVSLAAAEARVPKSVSAAALELSARRVNDAPKPLIVLDLKTPNSKPAIVFVEGPSPDWALPIPKPAQGAPAGRQHFGFEFDGLPPGVNPKGGPFELTFTIIEDGRAVEVKTHLD